MSQGSPQTGWIGTERQLREQLEDQRSRQRNLDQGDVVIEHPRRLFIRSPNGHFWRVNVADDGTLSTTDMGTSLL